MKPNKITQSKKPIHGFYESMYRNYGQSVAESSWQLAMRAIKSATRQPLNSIRVYLDETDGRYMASGVDALMRKGESLENAIQIEVERSMQKKVDARTEKFFVSVKIGTPMLTAKVIRAAFFYGGG